MPIYFLATEEQLEDALKSFPSAHASFVAFVAFFIVFYVHERFKAFRSLKTTLRPFIQLIVIGLCWWSALTRVKDYVHHPIDVLAGLLIGSGVALWSWPFMNELLLDIDETHKTFKYNINWIDILYIFSMTFYIALPIFHRYVEVRIP